MSWLTGGSQGFEPRQIKYLLPKYTRGKVLEIGCGAEKAFPHFIGYDKGDNSGHKTAADVEGDLGYLSQFKDAAFDAVCSSHVLGTLPNATEALTEWCRVLKPGGYLCLHNPRPKYAEEGEVCDSNGVYPGMVAALLDMSPFWFKQIEDEEYDDQLFEVYQKLKTEDGTDPDCLTLTNRPVTIKKTVCVCRFGGFGDMLQTALVFPRLIEQGYHLTVMTTPKGQDVLRHDPFVDDWYIVDQDQIPNEELTAFWTEQTKRFDRFVNLSESIEGYLLAMPGRVNHAWPHAVRKKRLNLNYHEWTAELAQVEFSPANLFYPSDDELAEAAQMVDPTEFNVLWALSGSSIHKFTPHQDAVLARMLLDFPKVRIFLVGDLACQILEQGWEDEARVVCLSDQLSIRQTLALAQQVDLVIGPETGVLNAVGMDKNPHKVLLLSHSSSNNLAKHWRHTQALEPENCSCWPCHRLHYGPEFCAIDEDTGAARCAVNIDAEVIYGAVEKVYGNWTKGRL